MFIFFSNTGTKLSIFSVLFLSLISKASLFLKSIDLKLFLSYLKFIFSLYFHMFRFVSDCGVYDDALYRVYLNFYNSCDLVYKYV